MSHFWGPQLTQVIATGCHIVRLKCTKFDFGWAPPQTPLGSLQRSPRLPSWIWGPLRSRGRGWAEEEEGKGRERGKWREGKGGPPSTVEPGPLRSLAMPLRIRTKNHCKTGLYWVMYGGVIRGTSDMQPQSRGYD